MGKNLKENIISILESNKGLFISGEKLANDLNVSRAAVWKVIKSLKNEGYDILSVSNKGYALSKETDILSSKIIKDNMPKYRDKFSFVIYKTVESTNIVARGMAMNGADSGTVVIAEEQTSGYGRNGKSFFSPYGTGIYMSIILNLKKEKKIFNSSFITTAAAMAVSKSIEEISNENTQIKWVNDVFINDKKVCGILTEGAFSFEDGKLDYAVIGIGINVNFPKNGFPEEINNIAVSINKIQNNRDIRNILIAKILERMYEYYFNNVAFYEEYRKRSFLIGRKVLLNIDNEEHIVKVLDIDKTFALVAEFQDGKVDRIISGSINNRLS
ncbi:biotin--[acetyl-CoA-carboxylase] ligase [Brachyspira hyodysenteriae]|uniref:biotin--[acetyl-CoA-carboxylase] ligase n=1 Tax=Brachyspira hyodysenteriae TaxID=159 RepID=UPI0022CDB05B|nr:biotin--[acetyl-CoA-carboxylase] ligase [Brachyspira hyodysenteriae]MCZ9837927.1 biotin--[acetyl-CoA-carboxylase] ligase [Brachyspira hyodysenteriae]MCZ9849044.1 biotin--[acetyl-CoA-carboxylase] ligase [Brachyspira hyodysenteriae]MCZ9849957.1 biotin--[acetyl-CoA-carboxylase] ligase [Brachyspira hyodysenteriae]MCZ9861220.1 biotin--[acetyl-CoA-carboxylase] ligase [Brachyspira hyodysenteriae]MCZ9874079.1 biotin--[acetyl-CoA-carboxylase] ligase [Brachyspira hyodysenteriae]